MAPVAKSRGVPRCSGTILNLALSPSGHLVILHSDWLFVSLPLHLKLMGHECYGAKCVPRITQVGATLWVVVEVRKYTLWLHLHIWSFKNKDKVTWTMKLDGLTSLTFNQNHNLSLTSTAMYFVASG